MRPSGHYMKGFVRSLPELVVPLSVLSLFAAFFMFAYFHVKVARISCMVMSGLTFGVIVTAVFFIVREFLDALRYDREEEEAKTKKLAEDVMES